MEKMMACVMELDTLILNFIWKNKYQPAVFLKEKKKKKVLALQFFKDNSTQHWIKTGMGKQLNYHFYRA